MEIIVGTFFIIFLIVFCVKEGVKEVRTGASLVVVLGLDIVAVGVLFAMLGNMAEENGWWALDIVFILLICPAMFGIFLVAVLLRLFDLVMPYELHRSTRLSTRARELSVNIDSDWLTANGGKLSQKYGWLKK